MSAIVRPEEVADLIRRMTELQHAVAAMGLRLEDRTDPLAVIARGAVDTVERELERAADAMKAAAPVVVLVTGD